MHDFAYTTQVLKNKRVISHLVHGFHLDFGHLKALLRRPRFNF